MNRQLKGVAAGAFMALATTACYDLTVRTTFDELTRDAVLADPVLIETVLAGTGINLWAAMQNHGRPWAALEVMGERTTSATDVNLIWQTGQEPRRQMENQVGVLAINATPWAVFYEANSSAAEMQRHIRDNQVRIIDPLTNNDQTPRALAWAKFVQGASHGYLSILFDRAAIVNMDVDLSQVPTLPLVEYTEVRDSALKWLNEAAVLAETNTFVYPYTNALWFWNITIPNNTFAQIVHTIIARVMVYSARTVAERDAVAWGDEDTPGTVLYHLARGISNDFGPGGDGSSPNTLLTYEYKAMTFAPPRTGGNCCGGRQLRNATRIDMRLLGPADTVFVDTDNDAIPDKSKYQVWLEKVGTQEGRDTTVGFRIESPDARIGNDESVDTEDPRTDIPIYFRFTSLDLSGNAPGAGTPIQPPERGLYYSISPYYSSSMLDEPDGTDGGRNTTGELADIPDIGLRVIELDMLKAEAFYRTNRRQEAVDIINVTRMDHGSLPAVDLNGPPSEPGCVPKRYDGTCGDLWDALMYEKRIETFGAHGLIPWADGRGWGCLLAGTVTEFPIPARQLDLMGEPMYTFGGQPGERGSAPPPTNCPLLFNPAS